MIKIKNLVKKYGHVTAVDHISFSLERGDVLAFLGPNGAGKSTTMKVISGFLRPTSGEVIIKDMNLLENLEECKALTGYMPESTPAYHEMTVVEYLRFIAEAYGLKDVKGAVERTIELTNLTEMAHKLNEALSKGYRSRLSFAAAIIHDPEILLLDEPTDGLDPNQKMEIRTLIKKLSKEKAIIVSTHILEEVASMCNRVVIISEGKIVLDGTPDDLQNHTENNGKLIVRLNSSDKERAETTLGTGLSPVSSAKESSSKFLIKANMEVEKVISQLMNAKIPLHEIYINRASLDGAFRKLTKTNE